MNILCIHYIYSKCMAHIYIYTYICAMHLLYIYKIFPAAEAGSLEIMKTIVRSSIGDQSGGFTIPQI